MISDCPLATRDFAAPLDFEDSTDDFEDFIILQLTRVISSAKAAARTDQDRRFAVGDTVRAGAPSVARQLHVDILENKRMLILSATMGVILSEQGLQVMARARKKRQLAAQDVSLDTAARQASAS